MSYQRRIQIQEFIFYNFYIHIANISIGITPLRAYSTVNTAVYIYSYVYSCFTCYHDIYNH